MRNLGELMLYIETLEFKDKIDLENILEDLLKNSDEIVKSSILTALKTLENVSEEELKEIKGNIK